METAKSTTAVHCFGRHVDAVGWRDHMWVAPDGRLGQIPVALLAVAANDAKLLSFGTGASHKDGLPEAEYQRQYALENLEELATHPRFATHDLARSRCVLEEALCETTSTNTVTELKAVGNHYRARAIRRVVAVTSPSHAPRCRRDIDIHWTGDFDDLRRNTYVLSSDVPFAGATVGDTCILEPPHRGDDPSPPFYTLVPRIFRIPADKKRAFFDQLALLIDTHL